MLNFIDGYIKIYIHEKCEFRFNWCLYENEVWMIKSKEN